LRVDTNTVLVVALSSLLLSFIAAVIQDAHAVNNTETLARVSEVVELGTPFLVQHYQTDVGKPQPLDKTSTGNFTGKGIINGNLSITAAGNATETFRNSNTSIIQGNSKFVTDNGDIARYNFQAIGTYNPDGTFQSRGAAFFDSHATGELSFLSNSVGIYKDTVDSKGNGTFLMWHWK
jgi:hypothetical protein